MLAVAAVHTSARCRLGARRREHTGGHTAVIGAAVLGAAVIGTAETGTAETGVVVIGTTGTAIGVIIIMIIMTSSSSAASAFRRGGAGDIHTDITAMGTRTITTGTAEAMGTVAATDTVATAMVATDIIMAKARLDTGTDPAPDQGWPSCNADLPGPAIMVAPLMESWGHKRAEQFELTSVTTDTQADPALRADCDESGRSGVALSVG